MSFMCLSFTASVIILLLHSADCLLGLQLDHPTGMCKKLHIAAQEFGSYYHYLLTVDSLTKRHRLGSLVTIVPSLSGPSMSNLAMFTLVRRTISLR